MRWDAQSAGGAPGDGAGEDAGEELPGLSLRGLLRTVTTPEFEGIRFHEVVARSALNQVPGDSPMPFRWTVNPYRGCSHACTYCLAGETRVLMTDGAQRHIRDLRIGDRVYGTVRRGSYHRYVQTEVQAHWQTMREAYRVVLADGTELVASADHQFLTERGWKHVVGGEHGANRRPHLTTNNSLLGFGRTGPTPLVSAEYIRAYLTGMIRGDALLRAYDYSGRRRHVDRFFRFRLALADGDALDRTQKYLADLGIPTTRFAFTPACDARRPMMAIRASSALAFDALRGLAAIPQLPGREWQRGFLAGFFDAEGSASSNVIRISNTDPELIATTKNALQAFGFETIVEDPHRTNGIRVVRVRGGLRECMRFLHLADPSIRRKFDVTGCAIKSDARLDVIAVEPLGVIMPMFDITTGTGNFIANGVVSHNCFARGTHSYLELDTGHGFDSEIVVKTNIGPVLTAELKRRSWKREHVALGTNTDPYQRAEGRYRLMPGVITALAGSGTPFSVLTKGTLLRRDLSLLEAAARDVPVGLGVSIAIWDDALHASLEPGAPGPKARLELVSRLRDAGLPCGVFMAPVLPALTDGREHLDRALSLVAASGATGVTVFPLHLRPGAREWFLQWLAEHHPALRRYYRRLYGQGSYVAADYRRWLAARVAPLLRAHGLDRGPGDRRDGELRGVPGEPEAAFPAGSLPDGAASGAAGPAAGRPDRAAQPALTPAGRPGG